MQLQINEKHTYSDSKAFVQTYEMTTSTWSTARVHSELGVVGNSSVATGGAIPMEVDAVVWKGSGKGKYGKDGYKGKGKSKDKGKGKNFQWNGAQKGKGKSKDSSKGKSNPGGGSGKGYGQSQKLDPNQCLYCHSFGHRKFQCRKYQADKAAGNVRQIQDEADSTAAGSSTAGASTVPTSAGVSTAGSSSGATGGNQSVRKITSVTPFVQDLTVLEEYVDASCDHFHVSMLQQIDSFDMTITDDDGCWTFSPDLHQVQHVRAVSDFRAGETVEILLDSGADASVLPLSCGDVGHSMAIDQSSHFVDAQRAPLGVTDKRVAELTLGNNIAE